MAARLRFEQDRPRKRRREASRLGQVAAAEEQGGESQAMRRPRPRGGPLPARRPVTGLPPSGLTSVS
jgi:hypothetical protein